MSFSCHLCDADEFHMQGGDWVCANGHVQNWTVLPDRDPQKENR